MRNKENNEGKNEMKNAELEAKFAAQIAAYDIFHTYADNLADVQKGAAQLLELRETAAQLGDEAAAPIWNGLRATKVAKGLVAQIAYPNFS